jgi:hypothetical protein
VKQKTRKKNRILHVGIRMQLCVPPGQLAMPAVPHLAQNLPMSGAFLGVGAHGVGVALPRSGEELVQSVREHCKALMVERLMRMAMNDVKV